jgi:hypothetical protein
MNILNLQKSLEKKDDYLVTIIIFVKIYNIFKYLIFDSNLVLKIHD